MPKPTPSSSRHTPDAPAVSAVETTRDWPFVPVCCAPEAFALMHRQTLPAGRGASAKRLLDSDEGLLAAACAVTRHSQEDVNVAECERQVALLAEACATAWRDAGGNGDFTERCAQSPQVAMSYLHRVLFEEAEFRGNAADYYNPKNSFLPNVLATHRGLPISLALVYKLVASHIGLRCWGVGLPGHFLAGVDCHGVVLVDCFHGGRLLDRGDAADRVAACAGPEAEFNDDLLRPVTHRHWITRLIQNLLQTYTAAGRYTDVAAMLELELLLWPDQHHLQRDLGLILARLGQPRPAAHWLGRYLHERPDDPQRADLEELLEVLG